MIMIASLALNLILGNINLNFEKKHGENNNLYHMARYGSDIILSVLDEIISSCYVIENEKKFLDISLFEESVNKYFETPMPNKEINFKLTDEFYGKKIIYDLKIGFRSSEFLKYNVKITPQNSYQNKLNLNQVIKYDKTNEKFFVSQEKIE